MWKHAVDGDVLIRTTHYSLPEHLHTHIELVQPTTYFGRPKAMRTTFHFADIPIVIPGIVNLTINDGSPPVENPGNPNPPESTNCSQVITVDCLLQLYNADSYTPVATNKNSIGITGYLGEYANKADLQQFYRWERPEAVNSTFTSVTVTGACSMHTYSGSFSGTHGRGCDFQAVWTTKISMTLVQKLI